MFLTSYYGFSRTAMFVEDIVYVCIDDNDLLSITINKDSTENIIMKNIYDKFLHKGKDSIIGAVAYILYEKLNENIVINENKLIELVREYYKTEGGEFNGQ